MLFNLWRIVFWAHIYNSCELPLSAFNFLVPEIALMTCIYPKFLLKTFFFWHFALWAHFGDFNPWITSCFPESPCKFVPTHPLHAKVGEICPQRNGLSLIRFMTTKPINLMTFQPQVSQEQIGIIKNLMIGHRKCRVWLQTFFVSTILPNQTSWQQRIIQQ